MENLADYYYQKINTTNKPGTELARFFCELFNKTVNVGDIKLFNRLVTAFGKYTVYFAILDMWTANPDQVLDHNWAALGYYCKRRLEKTNDSPINEDAYKSLESFVKEKEKEAEKLKKANLKPRSLDE